MLPRGGADIAMRAGMPLDQGPESRSAIKGSFQVMLPSRQALTSVDVGTAP